MPYDPINQIKTLAAHTVSTYDSVGGQSYVTGLAAARDARAIIDTIEHMRYIDVYECDECGEFYHLGGLAGDGSTICCRSGSTKFQIISKRKKK